MTRGAGGATFARDGYARGVNEFERILADVGARWFAVAVLGAALNAYAFAQMGFDKRRARLGRRRIPEARLAAPVLLGGLPGVILGMAFFRHKTSKGAFQVRVALYAAAFFAAVAGLGWWALEKVA